MSINEAIESFASYLKNNKECSDATVKTYRDNINKFLYIIGKEYNEVKSSDIDLFVKHEREKGNTGTTINLGINSLNHFYRFLNTRKFYINDLKFDRVSDNGQQKRLDDRDFIAPERFEEFIDKNEDFFRNHPCFLHARKWVTMYLLLYTGARKSEICDIMELEIEYEPSEKRYRVLIRHGSNDNDRYVYLPEWFKEPHELYLQFKHKSYDCEYYLCSTQNKKLHHTQINMEVDWMTKNVGFELDLSPHRCRDAAADYLLSKGCDIGTIAAMLGHKRVETTIKKYLRKHEGAQQNTVGFFLGR